MISMTITSMSFLIFILLAVVAYYITPAKLQWGMLLVLSMVFYCLAATPYTIVFIIISTLTAYLSTVFIDKNGADRSGAVVAITVILNAAIWFIMKGDAYWIQLFAWLHARVPVIPAVGAVPLASAFGMGYYTCQTIGYIVDCYWGTSKPQRNFFKLFLFLSFFPQLTTGPISHYNALQSLYEGRSFSIERIARGSQRILWGFFKKLVLSERMALVVNTVYGDLTHYTGVWMVLAALSYPVQLYADFSGSVDIVLGTAELFGIELPENFNNPFFAETSQEFWQKWHISLGSWARDYIMYPILKNEKTLEISERIKKKYGKRAGKLTSIGIGMFFTWLVMGIWHGNYNFIIGCGLYYWLIMILYEIFSPQLKKLNGFLGVKEDSFSWHLFKKIRTYLILCIALVFFRSNGVREAFNNVGGVFKAFTPAYFNPWIIFDGSLKNTGLTVIDFNVICISLILLLLAALMRNKCVHAREWISQQGLVFRWCAYLALLAFVLVYGKYGPGYHAADFIYQGF